MENISVDKEPDGYVECHIDKIVELNRRIEELEQDLSKALRMGAGLIVFKQGSEPYNEIATKLRELTKKHEKLVEPHLRVKGTVESD
jgi:hypothetical protein